MWRGINSQRWVIGANAVSSKRVRRTLRTDDADAEDETNDWSDGWLVSILECSLANVLGPYDCCCKWLVSSGLMCFVQHEHFVPP
jgi:hypothetical protein